MKATKLLFIAIGVTSLLVSSCTKDLNIIVGTGSVTTETLEIDQFSKIRMNGVDNVTITSGTWII